MKKARIFLFASFWALSQSIYSQVRFTEDRSRMSVDLKAVMEASKNEQAIKVGQTFDGLWNSSELVEKQKQQIYSILISMQKKRYKVNPQYIGYFSLFNNAVLTKGVKGAKLDSLIYVTSQVLENNPQQAFQKYLDFLNTFMEQNCLYNSNFNKLGVKTQKFSVWYIDPKTVANADAQTIEPAVSSVEKVQDENADWSTSFSEEKPKGSTDVNMQAVVGSDEGPSVSLPPISGPFIKIWGATFTFATKNDSTSFRNIKGTAMAFNNIFVGESGTFDWSYIGLKPNEVFADLNKYSMNLSKSEVYAENVMFTYKGKIEKPIKGSFAFKLANKIDKSGVPYPSFASYSNNVNLGNIGDGLILTGGFSLGGKVINTSSADMGNSTLSLTKAGVLKFKAVSKGFQITDSAITSRQAAIIIPFSGDSIFHFGVRITYLKSKNQLKLNQADGNYRGANYYDTYHKMEINSEAALYDVGKNKIDFYIINARNQVPVKIYSNDYFDEDKFDQLKGAYPFHPLQAAIGFSKSGKGNSFFADDLAAANKQNPATMRSAMSVLAQEGYAEYNGQTGFVKLTKKAWHYYLSKTNKKDFDGIVLQCLSPQKTNASLDLTTKKLQANGVKRTYFCRPLNVYLDFDSTAEVVVEKNRKLTFNGLITAGRFQFGGKGFRFDYDSFMVRMGQVDVVNINISKDYNIGIYGGENMKHKKLGIELDKSRGELYISKPTNKSGKKQTPEYPIFHASTGGVVYFDKKEILGGVYNRNVQFKIPPFTVDSLNSEQEQAIAFSGTFLSNGIFPDFNERLTLQHDISLGFEHSVPKEGYPIYGGKGRFYDKISLNMLGVRGAGKLETMGSTILSEDLIFYPDSLVAIGSSAEVKKIATAETHHPDIVIEEHEVKWFPKKDTLVFQTFNKPFSLYNGTASFDGQVGLTPKSSFATGKMTTNGSEIVSKKHQLKEESFSSRNADFKILSADAQKPTMVSSNAKIEFDLTKKKTIISPEEEGFASDTFPYIQYSTSISRCEWDMEKQTLTMGSKKDPKSKLANFYAISKEADSLQFKAGYAFYDIQKQYLNVKGVPFVRVSDVEILPDSNQLTVFEGGKIEELKNAVVRMDSVNKYHVFDRAKLEIVSRTEFKGDAEYYYKSSEKEKHKLKIAEFTFKDVQEQISTKRRKNVGAITRKVTIAKAAVSEEEKLHISEGILFKGDIEFQSNQKPAIFNGFAKLDLKRNKSVGSWIAYERTGDSSEVVINLKEAKTDNGTPVSTGIHMALDGASLYSSFVSSKETEADKDVFKVLGDLKYDATTKEYVVADAKKLKNNFSEGNLFSLNDNTSAIRFEGKSTLVQPLADFQIESSSIGKGNLDSSSYSLNTMLSIPMGKINPAALASMTINITAYATQNSAPYANDYTDQMRLKLVNLIGQKAFDGFEKQVGQGNQKTLSSLSKFASALVLSSVNLVWSSKHAAFYSVGKIGVSNILKKEVNATVDGLVEIKRNADGDEIRILLVPNAEKWYFISYQNARLALCSNDEQFTKAVKAKSKGEAIGKLYSVGADPSEKVHFNIDFNLNYLGKEIQDEYVPAEGTAPIEVLPTEDPVPTQQEVAPIETPQEPEKESKKKKKKGEEAVETTETETTPAIDPLPAEEITTPTEEETGKKKKKKDKKSEKEILENKEGF
jgi:hypothetical protein